MDSGMTILSESSVFLFFIFFFMCCLYMCCAPLPYSYDNRILRSIFQKHRARNMNHTARIFTVSGYSLDRDAGVSLPNGSVHMVEVDIEDLPPSYEEVMSREPQPPTNK